MLPRSPRRTRRSARVELSQDPSVTAKVYGMMVTMNGLLRPTDDRWLAGVCSGVARRFGWSVGLVRLLTVVAVLFLGLSLWVYIILWILIPSGH